MKPLVDPSAYSEQMSPMCRKLDILSDMFGTQGGKTYKKRDRRTRFGNHDGNAMNLILIFCSDDICTAETPMRWEILLKNTQRGVRTPFPI